MPHQTLWQATAPVGNFPTLKGEHQTDVAIIGGGITGITAAFLLQQAGKKVMVLEANTIASGTTGSSTGNLYAVIDKQLYSIKERWDKETMHAVAQSRFLTISFIEQITEQLNIDCHFKRVPFYLFLREQNEEHKENINKEYAALREAGLPAALVEETPLPFKIWRALKAEDQAQFHPVLYVQGLAAHVVQNVPNSIFEHSPAVAINRKTNTISTPEGSITASKIIMATHTPKGFNLLQAEMLCNREYGIASQIKTAFPPGIFWQMGKEHYSLRAYEENGYHYQLIIGKKHKVGQQDNNTDKYAALKAQLSDSIEFNETAYYWSGQHYVSADGLPYIGLTAGNDDIYIATGFSTDGLIYGALAAHLITDRICNKSNPWESLYNARRVKLLKSGKQFSEVTADVVKSYFKDYVLDENVESLNALSEGDGAIVEINGKKLAAYREAGGELIVLSPVCTHLKCLVHWNSMERSWDCPCHGSRFSYKGDVLEGPALQPLEQKDKQLN